jgi:pSer/pThr/pTyr-binding forkhead associated (FHA) protein
MRGHEEMQDGASPERHTPAGQASSTQGSVPSGSPYLEVVTSVTRMPPAISLSAVEHRIGRSSLQSDIVFENDITVSRLHASIVLEGTDYRIYDEGSSSGTWVNNQQVPEYGHQLQDGDEIRLGDTWLRYRR